MLELQRPLEEATRAKLEIFSSPTSPGSIGIIGLSGLTTLSSGQSAAWVLGVPAMPRELDRSATHVSGVVIGYRSREIAWRQTHGGDLQLFENEWVVLEDDKIVSHGKDPNKVVADARAKGIPTPYVFYVEPVQEEMAALGL